MPEKTSSPAATQLDNEVADADFQAREDNLINDLKSEWQTYHQVSLTVRHRTGQRINAECGLPSQKRQEYGAKILTRVSTELKISRSDISRMRKFAEACPDLDAFLQEHPGCHTWTQVKEHLARLNADGQPLTGKAATPGPARAICRGIRQLKAKLEQVENLSADDRKLIQRDFKELTDLYKAVVDKKLRSTVKVATESPSGTPNMPDCLPGNSAV